MPSSAPIEHQRAIQFAECPVCFDSMHSAPSGVFVGGDGRRTCAHFFHLRCAESVRDTSRGGRVCPICRAAFRTVLPVPSPDSDPEGWFRVVDLNGDGRLSQREVLEVLRAQVAVDYGQLEERLPGWWHKWDPQGTGAISRAQLLAEDTGLLHFVRRNLPGAAGSGEASPGSGAGGVPDIRADKRRWFQHFDYDRSGTLEKGEVVRGLIKTFGLGESLERTAQIAETVDAVWGVFDTDGSGTIEAAEFAARDGLADTIIASLA